MRISIATVARRLDAIESELGLKLIDRTAQGITVTQAGKKLLERAGNGEQLFADVERLAAGLRVAASQTPVRVSATEPVIGEILAPQLPRLIATVPAIRLDLAVENTVVSLALRDADLAVRLVQPDGDSLMAKRLPPLKMGLYASMNYLAGRTAIGDLSAESFIGYDDTYGSIPERRWITDRDLDGRVIVRTSSTRAMVNAVVAGAGIGILPQLLARRNPSLVELAGSAPIPSRSIWLVWHRDLKRSLPLKQVRDWIAASFAATAVSQIQ